jgi:putative transposase
MLLEQLTPDLFCEPDTAGETEEPESETLSFLRVERHIVVKSRVIDDLCFRSKNLYNRANYEIRQKFIGTSKEAAAGEREHAEWLRYSEIDRIAKSWNWSEYRELPAATSQQILMILDRNWKSFFNAVRAWAADKDSFTGRPKLPGYKHKTRGRNIVVFTGQQVKLKDGYIRFPGKSGLAPLKTAVTCGLRQVRIIPSYSCYVIEVVYSRKTAAHSSLDSSLYLGIDLGLNNLAALTSNQSGLRPLLINGCPLKSLNQFFNKRKAELMSFTGGTGTSKRIEKLTLKRNCKAEDYLHKTSRLIADYAVMHRIGNIVVGQNKDWKREINIGRKNNQSFVSVSFGKLVEQIQYKAEEIGIKVILTEESYTSKCSFFDSEEIGKHDEYKGRRVRRGLFETLSGRLVSADVNGSANIIRKVFPDAFADGTEGVGLRPVRVTPS